MENERLEFGDMPAGLRPLPAVRVRSLGSQIVAVAREEVDLARFDSLRLKPVGDRAEGAAREARTFIDDCEQRRRASEQGRAKRRSDRESAPERVPNGTDGDRRRS